VKQELPGTSPRHQNNENIHLRGTNHARWGLPKPHLDAMPPACHCRRSCHSFFKHQEDEPDIVYASLANHGTRIRRLLQVSAKSISSQTVRPKLILAATHAFVAGTRCLNTSRRVTVVTSHFFLCLDIPTHLYWPHLTTSSLSLSLSSSSTIMGSC
jgi:hypothetical protein